MLDNHRLLALTHQLQLVVDQLRDHVVLYLTPPTTTHICSYDMIEHVLVGVVKLVHVPADGVPQIHAEPQHDSVALLTIQSPHRTYCRVRAIAFVQTQGLHRDVVDVEVLHAVQRREGEGDHALKLGVVL